MTTNQPTKPARDLLAGDVINHRGLARIVLADALIDLDDDGEEFAYAALLPTTGQPLNLCLSADEPVEYIA